VRTRVRAIVTIFGGNDRRGPTGGFTMRGGLSSCNSRNASRGPSVAYALM
jgi:hypothetical protein